MVNAFNKRRKKANVGGALAQKESVEAKKDSITTVKTSVKTSYKVPPLTLRMSLTDKQEIAQWVDELQSMTGRKVSAAKLFRALSLYREQIDDEALIKLINQMN